jgi:hypothetical protein
VYENKALELSLESTLMKNPGGGGPISVRIMAPKDTKRTVARESKHRHRRKFAVGDKVKVTGMRPVTYPPGLKDELGTEELFNSMIGRVYTVKGFDEYGHVELHPNHRNWVWIEPEFLKLRARKKKNPR